MIIDDYRKAFDIMIHPGAATKQSMTMSQAVFFYWKATLIPVVLYALLIDLIGGQLSSATQAQSLASYGITSVIVATLAVVGNFIIAPIIIAIIAGLIYFIGKLLFGFQGSVGDTFTGLIYSAVVAVSLVFIPIVSTIVGLWSFVVALLAVANQNKTGWLQVLLSAIIGCVLLVIVIAAIFVAILSLGLLGG